MAQTSGWMPMNAKPINNGNGNYFTPPQKMHTGRGVIISAWLSKNATKRHSHRAISNHSTLCSCCTLRSIVVPSPLFLIIRRHTLTDPGGTGTLSRHQACRRHRDHIFTVLCVTARHRGSDLCPMGGWGCPLLDMFIVTVPRGGGGGFLSVI